jgi:hypothetical protein
MSIKDFFKPSEQIKAEQEGAKRPGGVTSPPPAHDDLADAWGLSIGAADPVERERLAQQVDKMRSAIAWDARARAATAVAARNGMIGGGTAAGRGYWDDYYGKAPAAPPRNMVELPRNIDLKTWRRAETDMTRCEFAIQCTGGVVIQLHIDTPTGSYGVPLTPREVIEDLQKQLVCQLALVALKEE